MCGKGEKEFKLDFSNLKRKKEEQGVKLDFSKFEMSQILMEAKEF